MFRGLIASALALLTNPALAAETPLSLAETERLALAGQPLLAAQGAQVRAARERAVAMRQLPDPMLVAGVTNLPVNGGDSYSLSADLMTMTAIGLMQEFPRAEKRRLRSRAETLMADAGAARLDALQRAVRRDAALAWLDAWFPAQAAELAQAMASEAERERTAAEIAYRAGRAPQADVLEAEVEAELLRDRARKFEQEAARARELLARWIGHRLTGPLADNLPPLPEPPELDTLLAALERHPEIHEVDAEIAVAGNAVAVAQQEYRPDWRVEAMYGWRPEFDEMVTVQVGIDLPFFTGRRQDRTVAAAVENLGAVTAMHDDHIRRLRAEAAGTHRAWSEARSRLARYDEVIVPRAGARADAALAAYRAGRAQLSSVLSARRAALEASLMRLELLVDVSRQRVQLRYFNAEGG